MVQESISIQRENAPLQVTSDVKTAFHSIAKWALILSSIGFIVVTTVLMAAMMNALNMGILRGAHGASPFFVGAGYVLVSLLLYIPLSAIFGFGLKLKTALKEDDQLMMNHAFGHLKSGMKYSCMAIIGVVVFGLLGSFF